MESCKMCIFYNAEYDEVRQQYVDTLKVGDVGEKHFCVMYDHPIDPDIVSGKKQCQWCMGD